MSDESGIRATGLKAKGRVVNVKECVKRVCVKEPKPVTRRLTDPDLKRERERESDASAGKERRSCWGG
jgi:hypothetical protein